MNCFTGWFDSPYYHLLYKNRDNKEAEFFIDNLIFRLQIQKKARFWMLVVEKGDTLFISIQKECMLQVLIYQEII